MWKYLNPLNWLDWLSVIKQVLDIGKQIYAYVVDLITKKQQKDEVDELRKAVDHAKNAQTPEDKALAACEIEKSFNPDATCGPRDGKQ